MMEVGDSQFAEVQPSDFPTTDALLQAVDANYRQECAFLKGQFDIRSEWVWSDVGTATYDPTGSGSGSLPSRRLMAISQTLAADRKTSFRGFAICLTAFGASRSGSVFHQSQT